MAFFNTIYTSSLHILGEFKEIFLKLIAFFYRIYFMRRVSQIALTTNLFVRFSEKSSFPNFREKIN